MAFQQGLSGLNVSSKALDVVSNNIANASTVGFKNAQAHFADVYANALNGGGAVQVGIGASLMAVQQQFTQGNISVTNNPLDIAINGNGFFRLQMSTIDQSGYYTRNGQFHLDKDGYIVNSNGGFLTGYASPDGVTVNTAAVSPISVGTGGIPPRQTGWSSSVDPTSSGLTMSVNLDNRDESGLTVTDPDWEVLDPFVWDSTFNTGMYNYSTSATVYDQSGAPHTLTNYYVRLGDGSGTYTDPVTGTTVSDSRAWAVYTSLDSQYMLTDTASPPVLSFQPNGVLAGLPSDYRFLLNTDPTAWSTIDGSAIPAGVSDWFDPAVDVYMDLGESTQFGSAFDTNEITQDGYAAGMLTRVTVDENGFVQGNYSNGQTKIMGQVVLTEFRNPNGLQSVGDNMWIETTASGQPLIGTPGAGTRGSLQAGAVEESNTDLTAELVTMIVMQRNYQANAQSIKTQDQILQTLVNLR